MKKFDKTKLEKILERSDMASLVGIATIMTGVTCNLIAAPVALAAGGGPVVIAIMVGLGITAIGALTMGGSLIVKKFLKKKLDKLEENEATKKSGEKEKNQSPSTPFKEQPGNYPSVIRRYKKN